MKKPNRTTPKTYMETELFDNSGVIRIKDNERNTGVSTFEITSNDDGTYGLKLDGVLTDRVFPDSTAARFFGFNRAAQVAEVTLSILKTTRHHAMSHMNADGEHTHFPEDHEHND